MTQHSWKSSDLIEVKANLHRYTSRISFFIKTAVKINNSLDPGPEVHAGLHHGVPVEGPQHLLHLLDQILGFAARLFNDPYFGFAPHKITKRVVIRLSGRPDLLLHLRNRKASKTQSRSSCFRRQGCHRAKRSDDDFQLSKCILRHQFLTNSSKFFYYCKQCSCWWFQKPLITTWYIYLAQSPETLSAPMLSCWFIFAGTWLFVYNYVSTDSRDGFAEKNYWKRFFLTRRWSIEIVPEISLPPCTLPFNIG